MYHIVLFFPFLGAPKSLESRTLSRNHRRDAFTPCTCVRVRPSDMSGSLAQCPAVLAHAGKEGTHSRPRIWCNSGMFHGPVTTRLRKAIKSPLVPDNREYTTLALLAVLGCFRCFCGLSAAQRKRDICCCRF